MSSSPRIRAGSFVVAVTTITALASPAMAYRTGADQAETSDTDRVRWADPSIGLSLVSSGAPGVPFAMLESSLDAAMNGWNAVACADARLSYRGAVSSSSPDDGTSSIEWIAFGWQSRGFAAGSAGVTDLVYQRDTSGQWTIAEADVYLNGEDFTWTTGLVSLPAGARSADVVLAHELGHVLGILHPCEPGSTSDAPDCASDASFETATMFPTYVGPEQASLAADDEAGLCFLYPSLPCGGGCPAGSTCLEGQCRESCGDGPCGLGETCVAGQCKTDCIGLHCLSSGTCDVDDDCETGTTCAEGLCLPAGGDLGDPCDDADDCVGGICVDGACSIPCVLGCPGGWTCDAAQGGCAPGVGTFGDPCDAGEGCTSGVCVLRGEVGTCSRRCGAERVPCVDGYSCAAIGAESVCVRPSSDGGCSVGRRAGSGTPGPAWIVLSFSIGWLFVRRRREVGNAQA